MTILDANLLLYAYNADAPQQEAAARWLTELFEGGETIAIPWVTIWAFLRLATNPRIHENPLTEERAFGIVREWLALPDVIPLQAGPRHAEFLGRVLRDHQATGALVGGAVLAALALENGATLASSDQNFSRFEGLRWVNPLRG